MFLELWKHQVSSLWSSIYGQPSMVNRPQVVSRTKQLFARKRWTAGTVAGYLLIFSILYLAIPHFLFFFGWLRWYWALLATGALCAALVATVKMAAQAIEQDQEAREGSASEFILTRPDALLIGAICLIWLTISGVGGFASQDPDWTKHNTVLNSLIRKPWPTIYEVYQINVPLVYYIAYYLPAALVGKVGGWLWANSALFVWSLGGLFLVMLWFCVFVQRISYSVLLLFIFFSGLDVIGRWLALNATPAFVYNTSWSHIERWSGIWQYSSNATLINWVPHQALAGWLVMATTLYCMVKLQRRELVLLPFGLSALWSPFVTVGMLPFLVFDFLIDKEPFWQRVRRTLSMPNVVGVLVLALTGLYFGSKVFDGSPIAIQDMRAGLSIENYDGTTIEAIINLAFFALLEFGLFAIVLYRSGAVEDEGWRWLFDITVLTLCILPWFKLGAYNDLVMRASIPALFVLAITVGRAVHNPRLAREPRMALVILLLFGAVTAGIEFKRHVEQMGEPAPIFDEAVQEWDLLRFMQQQTYFFGQYTGAIDSPFFMYMAKSKPVTAQAAVESREQQLNDHDFVLYGNRIYLLQDSVALPAEIAAGSTITVPMELHFVGPFIGQAYDPSLRLVDENGEAVWTAESWPGRAPETGPFWITQWSGAITMTVPVTAAPGLYSLEVGFRGEVDNKYLVAYSVPEGEAIGEVVPVTVTRVTQ